MSPTPQLLSPERLQAIHHEIDTLPATVWLSPSWSKQAIIDLLAHLGAQREQFRLALEGLLEPELNGFGNMNNIARKMQAGIVAHNTRICEAALSLGIDLTK